MNPLSQSTMQPTLTLVSVQRGDIGLCFECPDS
jgi:hypothetical protein